MPLQTVILASGNPGKLREFAALLADLDVNVVPQSEYHVSAAEETGFTFVENALIKARHAALASGLPALSDDSGIAVDALNGAPGIYSARYAGANASDLDNLNKLIKVVRQLPAHQRSARYHCVIAFMQHAEDPMPVIASGTWEGRLIEEPRGEGGFGYDPIFYLDDYQCTAAELDPADKNRLSHRGQALRGLLSQLTAELHHGYG
ncbi:MAG: RdgB/HAM1 family non-canonical purine NTP pyrophosphatase [Gammaproteobacteria bacterium]|nr:RdgB/HAM1 family non-canonical purine NTP pyrophosphatase [Gammaproteobacteria bacterium]